MSTLTWPLRLTGFVLWFIWAVITSNVQVLRDNLTPGQDSRPGIARLVTRCSTDIEVTFLAVFITLTPGTLTVGTATREDGDRVLYVHGMYSQDADDLRDELRDMETRMLRAFRRKGLVDNAVA